MSYGRGEKDDVFVSGLSAQDALCPRGVPEVRESRGGVSTEEALIYLLVLRSRDYNVRFFFSGPAVKKNEGIGDYVPPFLLPYIIFSLDCGQKTHIM